jgi:hypothetical protein
MNIKLSRQMWVLAGITATLAMVILVGTAMAQEPDGKSEQSPTGGGSPPNSMTYQGYLEDGGQPANGVYDFQASIWDQESGGNQIGGTAILTTPVTVQDGIFTLYINPLGANQIFTGGERWLQVEVRPHGTGSYTILPRQPIANVPYAWGLRPRAVISSSMTPGGSWGTALLNLENNTPPGLPKSNPRALDARSLAGTAVQGEGGSIGVYGHASVVDGIGVAGTQTGYSTSDIGTIYKPGGLFGGRNGVIGVTKHSNGAGVRGLDKSTIGGWAGYFTSDNGNGVHISTEPGTTALEVVGGTKNAVVRTDEGSKLLYTEESTEVWFTDYGFGQLEDGVAVIAIDPLFAKTVDMEEPYHVFVQVYGDAEVYVSERTPTGFEVHLRDGGPEVEFSYRIVAKRLGYANNRLEPAPWADDDPNLYPEKDITGGLR